MTKRPAEEEAVLESQLSAQSTPQGSIFKKSRADHPEGSWECRFCSNVNWPKRTTCNKPNCNMPKESSQHPEGSWACTTCKNVNWPKRTNCNKCGESKFVSNPMAPMHQSQPVNIEYLRTLGIDPTYLHQLQLAQMSGDPYGASNFSPLFQPLRGIQGAVGASTTGDPPGSWPCVQCGNVNWPKRTACNKPGCGAPKPALYGGIPISCMLPAVPPQPTHPEGSWHCQCGNINWPQRTTCNKKSCNQPRPLV